MLNHCLAIQLWVSHFVVFGAATSNKRQIEICRATNSQKDEEKKKEVPAKVLEVRRQPSGAAQARDRARGNRGGDRNSGRGMHPLVTKESPLPCPPPSSLLGALLNGLYPLSS